MADEDLLDEDEDEGDELNWVAIIIAAVLVIGLIGSGDFGVPLHGDEKGVVGQFQGFDGAIWCSGGDVQALADAIDGLMVPGGSRRRGIAHDCGQTGLLLDLHAVPGRATGRHPVCKAQPDRVGQVGDECAAERYVEHLQAAADA